jgi:ribosomal protein L37AE/L43A
VYKEGLILLLKPKNIKQISPNGLICDRCKRKNLYHRVDGTYFCRSCGFESSKGENK